MKPFHIGLLVIAGAFGGAVVMKFMQKPQPAPITALAPVSTAAPAAEPPAAAPSPFPEKKEAAAPRSEAHRKPAHRPKPAETTLAQNQPPAETQSHPLAPATAPESVKEPPPAPAPPASTEPEHLAPAPPAPPHKVTLAAGTLLPVRLVEGLSSDRNQPGDGFTATLDALLVVDGFVIAERGARLEGRVVEAEKAGRVKGVSSLAIELTRLTTADGQHIAIQTDTFTKQGAKTVGEDAAKVGAAAGIGAAIGAIAGGGKGAGIGAAIGGAAGAGDVLLTRGKPAVLSTETKINFRLRQAVTLTERQGKR